MNERDKNAASVNAIGVGRRNSGMARIVVNEIPWMEKTNVDWDIDVIRNETPVVAEGGRVNLMPSDAKRKWEKEEYDAQPIVN